MTRNRLIITMAFFMLVIISLLIFHLHSEGIREVVSQFQRDQLSYANHLSNQIQFYIRARARGLRAISSLDSIRSGDVDQGKSDIERYGSQIKKIYVQAVTWYDLRGRVIHSTDPRIVGADENATPFFPWAQKPENRGKISLLPFPHGDESLRFSLAIPLYQESPDGIAHPDDPFAGVLAFTLDMKKFLLSLLGSAEPKVNLDQIWIMDRGGRLLFQPDHPEMVSRNIHEEDGKCRSCHRTFHYIEEILARGQGTLDYQIRDHPKKIGAFASVTLENAFWTIVVNAPYNIVIRFTNKSLKQHLLLVGIVILGFTFGSALILHQERMKIKAEEEALRWQERMAERKKAEEILHLERNKLKGILDAMKDGIYIVTSQHEIQYVNPAIEREFGPVNGGKCYAYLRDLSDVCPECRIEEVLAGKTLHGKWHSLKSGRTYNLLDTPIVAPDGTISKLQIMRDITDRENAERALRQSEERFRTLVETMNDGLGVQDETGVWIYVNNRLCEMLGYSEEEMIGFPVVDFVSGDFRRIYEDEIIAQRQDRTEPYELCWLRKDGRKIWSILSPKPMLDEKGEYKGSFAVITEITEQKRVEEALKESEQQLRILSSQILTAQETERKRISRELHDELGQALMVIKLRLNYIERNLADHQIQIRSECKEALEYVDQLIENVRRLSRDLSPSILEDFGLSAALRWLVTNFARNHSIKVKQELKDVDSLVPESSHVMIYRMVQEMLTNVAKYSGANWVSVSAQRIGAHILFSVEDNGSGFDVREVFGREPAKKGLGLETMRGRAQMIGGSLEIRAQKGEGTRISLRVPMNKEEV